MKTIIQTLIIALSFVSFPVSVFGLIPCKNMKQKTHTNIKTNTNIKINTNVKQIPNTKTNTNIKLSNTLEKPFVYEETWDAGEVSWDINSANIYEFVNEPPTPREHTNREKIWGLVEELRIQGIISGVLSVAYYNTALGDSFFNDIQNFEIKPNMNLKNIIITNFSSELDVLLSLSTLILYKSYKSDRIPKVIEYWRNTGQTNMYIEEYSKVRKWTTKFALITIIIFCKSVKNAI